MEDWRSEDNKVSGRVWEIVETKARKTRIAKTKRERKEEEKRKEVRKKRKKK